MQYNFKIIFIGASAAFLMAGCGGGGGGDTISSPVPLPTPVTIGESTIVSEITASDYGAGSAKEGAYIYINAQRVACGFGALQQNARLDRAAQAHSDYLAINNISITHFEDETRFPNGFTGVFPQDRGTAQGYASTGYGEVIADDSLVLRGATTSGQARVMDLFTGPYHGMAQLLSLREIGIGHNVSTRRGTLNINMGTRNGAPAQLLASNAVATYPCQGTTGILSQSYASEFPTPVPNRNIGAHANPIGHPIYVQVRDAQTLLLHSADLRKTDSSTPLALIKLDAASDHNHALQPNVIVYMPDAPLEKNTAYQFNAAGTNNGQAVNVSFTFSTGAF